MTYYSPMLEKLQQQIQEYNKDTKIGENFYVVSAISKFVGK